MRDHLERHELRRRSDYVRANVRAESARRGWTQADLARHAGMSRTAIGERHRGETPWTVDELEALSHIFGVQVADLMGPAIMAGVSGAAA